MEPSHVRRYDNNPIDRVPGEDWRAIHGPSPWVSFLLVRYSIVLVLVSRVEPSKGRMHASSRTTISPISMSFFFPSMVYSSESSTARYLVFLRVFISRHIQALGTEVDESLCLLRMAAAAVRIARRRIGSAKQAILRRSGSGENGVCLLLGIISLINRGYDAIYHGSWDRCVCVVPRPRPNVVMACPLASFVQKLYDFCSCLQSSLKLGAVRTSDREAIGIMHAMPS